jgi:hypothetical protein
MKPIARVSHLLLSLTADPLEAKLGTLQRAQRLGIARAMDPLERALAEADAIGIEFYGQQLQSYLEVVKRVAPILETVPAPSLPSPTQAPRSKLTLAPSAPPLEVVPASPEELPTYVISSATLAQAFAAMVHERNSSMSEPERMLAVTGIARAGLRTLDHLIDVKMGQQTPVSASFDMQDFARVLLILHDHNQALHAIFHTHPFAGPPTPSSVDWRLQELLDQGGYPAIQAVFSSDGYIRFFAKCPFVLEISGKGVEHVDDQSLLFRLVNYATLPYPRHAA